MAKNGQGMQKIFADLISSMLMSSSNQLIDITCNFSMARSTGYNVNKLCEELGSFDMYAKVGMHCIT